MKIMITPVSQVRAAVQWQGVTHVISLLVEDDRSLVKLPWGFNPANHLFLDMDDVINPESDLAPTRHQVLQILNWTKNLPHDSVLLVHCFAGVSRSTAAALAIKVQELGVDQIDDAIAWLISVRPQAFPNPVIIQIADELLKANGKLFEKSEALANSKIMRMLE